jgi:hypothetical protein
MCSREKVNIASTHYVSSAARADAERCSASGRQALTRNLEHAGDGAGLRTQRHLRDARATASPFIEAHMPDGVPMAQVRVSECERPSCPA